MMASRSARSLAACFATAFRVVVALGAAFVAATGASFAFSLVKRGFLATAFFVVAATGGAGADAFVVAARALVVLVGAGGGTVGAVLVREEARVAAVGLDAISNSKVKRRFERVIK